MTRTDTDDDTDRDAASTGTGGADAGAGGAAGEGAPHVCGYCGRAFARADWLALHRGLAHEARLDGDERAAFADAREREAAALREFRLKALVVLVVLYFGFVMAYSFFG